jgi:NifU-like protein
MQFFPWYEYSRKTKAKIEDAKNAGTFSPEEALMRNCQVAIGSEGCIEDGNLVEIALLVDKEDGMILDAKFQLVGQTPLIAAAEALCEIVIQKYYDQAKRIGCDLIEKHLRDKNDKQALPSSVFSHINLLIDALDNAINSCFNIELPPSYVTPLPKDIEVLEGGYPGFDELLIEKQLNIIKEVIEVDIKPYIELDGGGVEVINLLNKREVIIAYEGNCTSCFSSTGATLSYIQQTLRAKVHPEIIVTPNL